MSSSISSLRLYLLRGLYLLLAVGLGLSIWPSIPFPAELVADSKSVVRAFLGAVGLLALLGIRHPLRMLPLLLFEGAWKAIWLLAFALPLWRSGTLDANAASNAIESLVGVALVVIAVPWGYVARHYLKAPGDPWGRAGDNGDA